MKPSRKERGQALILIAIAAVGLFGFAALAIDGSMVFSVKRRAQNAADSAALAAALAKTRHNDWHQAAMDSTVQNTFNNDGSTNTVEVYQCDDPAASCTGLPTGADPTEYIQVIIVATIDTKFTNVVGRDQTQTAVEAIARSVPGYNDEMVFGNVIVALNQTDCNTFWGNGNPEMTTIGGGVFVNSTADCALNFSGHPTLTTPSISVAGPAPSDPIAGATYNAGQVPYPPMVLPDPSCGTEIAVRNGDTMNPGTWNGDFPPNGVKFLNGGIYCINNGDFRSNGNDELIGNEVVIRVNTGAVRWNGNGALKLSAPTEGPYEGLLLFLPLSNTSEIRINGTNDQELTGSILAPASPIVFSGTAGSNGFNSQVIGNTVQFSGNFEGTFRFDDTKNYHADIPPTVQLTK